MNLTELKFSFLRSSKDFLTVRLPVTFSLFALLLFLFYQKDYVKQSNLKHKKLHQLD